MTPVILTLAGVIVLLIALLFWMLDTNQSLRSRLGETEEELRDVEHDLNRAMTSWGECERALDRAERKAKP